MKKIRAIAITAAASITAFAGGVMGTKALLPRMMQKNKDRQKSAENNKLIDLNKSAENVSNSLTDDVLFAMVDTFENKTQYSSGHSGRVAKISRQIGEKLGIKDLNGLYYIALLHDVGKIYTPDILLNKSKLSMTPEERGEWEKHPIAGAKFVSSIPELQKYADAVMHHHERYDGSGYPDGLAGEEIPMFSRIIGVADTYEAMSSERQGREAYPREYIMSEFRKCSGTQFDPMVVKAMMAVIADTAEQ